MRSTAAMLTDVAGSTTGSVWFREMTGYATSAMVSTCPSDDVAVMLNPDTPVGADVSVSVATIDAPTAIDCCVTSKVISGVEAGEGVDVAAGDGPPPPPPPTNPPPPPPVNGRGAGVGVDGTEACAGVGNGVTVTVGVGVMAGAV